MKKINLKPLVESAIQTSKHTSTWNLQNNNPNNQLFDLETDSSSKRFNLESGDIIYTIKYYCYVEVHNVDFNKKTFDGYCLNISDAEKNFDINAGYVELDFDDIETHFKIQK